MLTIYDNTSDISSNVVEGSVTIGQQLNNRRDIAKFQTFTSKVIQGHSVYIYETFRLVQNSSSGTAVIYISPEDAQAIIDNSKWRTGDVMIVDIKGSEVKYTIQSINTSSAPYSITLTANLAATVTAGTTKVGRLLFGGVVLSNPDEEISISGTSASTMGYSINCVDWSNLADRKIVVQEYQNMYIRELIGRVVYGFCAFDSQLNLDSLEAAWTQSGVALAMADETTDRIEKAKSQKTGTSGAGTAIWSKSISATDISAYTHVRFWWKIGAGYGTEQTSLKLRLGTDSSNYFEYTLTNIGASFEDCWNFESVILSVKSATVGTPSLAAVTYMALVTVVIGAIPTGNIWFDQIFATTGGFTIQNVTRGLSKFTDVRVQYQKPTDLFETLTKAQAFFWSIDTERDVHVFTSTATAAPFALTDSSTNYSNLIVEADITQLKNRQIVKGGEAASTSLYTQNKVADGSQTSFALDYKPSQLTMTVGGVAQTLGEEGFVDQTTVQWVFNFQEKVVKKTLGTTTPAAAAAIVFTYYPYQPIRVQVTSPTSIATMLALTGGDGYYDGTVIDDASLVTFADARLRGQAELTQFANAIVTVTFYTEIDGLRAGQILTLTDTTRAISAQQYLIQKVEWSQRYRDHWSYQITACSTLFGLVEFIQMLLNRTTSLNVSPSEFVDTLMNVDEVITIADVVTPTAKNKTVYAALKLTKLIDWIAESGSTTRTTSGVLDAGNQWYVEFNGSETGSAAIDASTNHNNGKALKITTAVGGGSSHEIVVRNINRIPWVASTSTVIDVWIEIPTALTNVSSGGARLLVKEYDSSGALLATNTIISGLIAAQNFTKSSATFTSNASTASISIFCSLYQAAGIASFADITMTPATTETATLAGQASFCQAT